MAELLVNPFSHWNATPHKYLLLLPLVRIGDGWQEILLHMACWLSWLALHNREDRILTRNSNNYPSCFLKLSLAPRQNLVHSFTSTQHNEFQSTMQPLILYNTTHWRAPKHLAGNNHTCISSQTPITAPGQQEVWDQSQEWACTSRDRGEVMGYFQRCYLTSKFPPPLLLL